MSDSEKSAAALALVKKVYEPYVSLPADDTPAAADANAKANSTDEFLKKIDVPLGSDPYLCAQNFPETITYSEPVINGNTALVTVTEKFESGPNVAKVSVDIKQNKISDVECPVIDQN